MAFFERTKTGRLKMPASYKRTHDMLQRDLSGYETNIYGEPVPQVGDFVWMGPISGVSAGTVGKISVIDFSLADPISKRDYHVGYDAICLDGKEHSGWLSEAVKLTPEAVQEVKDFYIADGRPERIKVDW